MGLFQNIAHAMQNAANEGEDVAAHVLAQILRHPEVIAIGPIFGRLDPLTGAEEAARWESVRLDLVRAARAQFPDRAEEIIRSMELHVSVVARASRSAILEQVLETFPAEIRKELEHPHWSDDHRHAFELALKWFGEAIAKARGPA